MGGRKKRKKISARGTREKDNEGGEDRSQRRVKRGAKRVNFGNQDL
jgi:hypothetical protein